MPTSQLPLVAKTYVACVILAGLAVAVLSLTQITAHRPDWLILAAFTLVSGTLTIRVPSISANISVSEMFVFTAVVLYGVAPGTVIVALDGLILSISSASRRPERVLFNIAEPSLSIWVAAQIFYLTAGVVPLSLRDPNPDVVPLLFPIALMALVYFLLNSWLNSIAIGFAQRKSAVALWREHFAWLSLNYFGGASVAVLLVRNSGKKLDPVGFAVILPLLLITYLTHKYSGGRLEDATKHIQQLRCLYLSTIETLAMAIDAKDQITHGHIRRVQMYAVALAKALGISDDKQIGAIEAAALLHDAGKLAVPEYILNKPGKLTPAEFEKMKLHATVGADILSSIDFPYPVVPVVRHHHENWDGTGYPAGLAGTDIPIGARILAVVDCFDALTSERPYRPKLPDAEALQILTERRGSMYDPLIVDTFLQVHQEIEPPEVEVHSISQGLRHIAESTRPLTAPRASRLEDIAASSGEILTLYDLARGLAGRTSLADAADMLAKHLRRLLPASICVFYVYDTEADELVAAHVTPDTMPIAGIRIANGDRIAGWVAANRETIINSDPALDFGGLARTGNVQLRSCLSTPLVVADALVGVLTVCSTADRPYTDDHIRMIEAINEHVARVVRDAAIFDHRRSACMDVPTGLPTFERLTQLTPGDTPPHREEGKHVSLLYVRAASTTGMSNTWAGPSDGRPFLKHVASVVRRVLRGADILFRSGDHDFVVVLSRTDYETACGIAKRIRNALAADPYSASDGSTFESIVAIGVATAPLDGPWLNDLVDVARRRLAVVSLRSRLTSSTLS